MKINNVELDFDLYDADNVELRKKYYQELEKMKTVAEDLPKGDEAEQNHYLCKRIKSIFDEVFGRGTGIKVCGSKDNLLTCMKAYEELVSEQMRQDQEYKKIMQTLKGKGNKGRKNAR